MSARRSRATRAPATSLPACTSMATASRRTSSLRSTGTRKPRPTAISLLESRRAKCATNCTRNRHYSRTLPRGRARRRTLADGHIEVGFVTLAQDLHLGDAPRRQLRDLSQHSRRVDDRLPIDRQDHIERLHPCLACRRAALDTAHHHTFCLGELEHLGQLRRHVVRFDAEVSARHLAALDELVHHLSYERSRDRETDADRVAGA